MIQKYLHNRKFQIFTFYFIITILWGQNVVNAQNYWQQTANYEMKVLLDVEKNTITGIQHLDYFNSSPDTLHQIYYHLYWNAFQPNSMMDVRSRNLPDPDDRVGDRIQHLGPDEIGYQKILRLTQEDEQVKYNVEGTILVVELDQPILPNSGTNLRMEFQAQVPAQIRRAGRDNKEGIRYSMSQWYPKLCAYDEDGWHTNPYIAREFYGNWGDFDVTITTDKDYVVAASGQYVGTRKMNKRNSDNEDIGYFVSHQFVANNVHDFVWAADPDYTVDTFRADCGVLMKFYYQVDTPYRENWEMLPKIMNEAFNFANEKFGAYPYDVYSFIQGGDGGMEYPTATLITGERSLRSLVGVSVHELMHSWYQMVLATDEAQYAWMDEGFTSYTSALVMNHLTQKQLIPGQVSEDPLSGTRNTYANFIQMPVAEPLSVHADHFNTNAAYSVASYVGGSVILDQLGYVISDSLRDLGLKKYFNSWKFKHPTPNDFFRVMERVSGIELDWMRQYLVYTKKIPNYGVDTVAVKNNVAYINLVNHGGMPYPQDVKVEFEDGSSKYYNIPLRIMRGHKPLNEYETPMELQKDWLWTHPEYTLEVELGSKSIKKVMIDPASRSLDADRSDNVWPKQVE